MTVVIPPAVASEIAAQARATDGSPRALDQVARRHGLMLAELRELLSREVVTVKRCTNCGETKPTASGFYAQVGASDGLASNCIACNNRRTPTVNRMLRNRARTRATAALIERHKDEFKALTHNALAEVEREHENLAGTAAARGQHDAGTARLKPGPKRPGQSLTDRLDVARCTTCHTHHDADHECPSCGETTPDTAPSTKAHLIRAWAQDNGMDVPQRGPVPQRVVDAYLEHHTYTDQESAS